MERNGEIPLFIYVSYLFYKHFLLNLRFQILKFRISGAATVSKNNEILVLCGTPASEIGKIVAAFDGEIWTKKGELKLGRKGHGAIYNKGQVWVIGGDGR